MLDSSSKSLLNAKLSQETERIAAMRFSISNVKGFLLKRIHPTNGQKPKETSGPDDRNYVKQVPEANVEKVANRADDIKRKFSRGGPLGRFVEDAELLVSIVKDYGAGKYREIPYLSMAAIVFTLLYVVNPLDLIPDVIPVIGQLDDAAVVTLCLVLVEQDLRNYKEWKTGHASNNGAQGPTSKEGA